MHIYAHELVPNSDRIKTHWRDLLAFPDKSMEVISYPSRSLPSSSSTSSFSSGNLVDKVKEFFRFALSAVVGNVFSAIFTFFFALGASIFLLFVQFLCEFSVFRSNRHWLVSNSLFFCVLWPGFCINRNWVVFSYLIISPYPYYLVKWIWFFDNLGKVLLNEGQCIPFFWKLNYF